MAAHHQQSHDDYVSKLLARHSGNIVVVGQYVKSNIKIEHKCLICNHIWMVRPNNLLSSNGCPPCSERRMRAARRKTDEKYREDLRAVHDGNIRSLAPYTRKKDKIEHICTICEYKWSVAPGDLLQGRGCPNCAEVVKKTPDTYRAALAAVHGDEIIALEDYINAKVKLLHKHISCGREWSTVPSAVLGGSGCKPCSDARAGRLKAYTQEEYIERLKAVHGNNFLALGNYVNNHTKILHKHVVCGSEWEVIPANLLRGQGCPKCAADSAHSTLSFTHEEYLERLAGTHNGTIVVLEEYINMTTNIMHEHTVCGYRWAVRPGNILSGKGCPSCAGSLQKTTEIYRAEIAELFNGETIVIGEYVNNKVAIIHKHVICGYEWSATPHDVLDSTGCPQCADIRAGARRLTNDQYLAQLRERNIIDIIPLQEYVTAKTYILHRHVPCGREYMVAPTDVISGSGCIVCLGLKKKNTQEYAGEVSERHRGSVVVIGEYANCKVKVAHKCFKCGHIWQAMPINILKGRGCPKCATSYGEKTIGWWLDDHNIKYEIEHMFEDCRYKRKLQFDFYLPELNSCIEYDGYQHFYPLAFGKSIDANKQFEENKIRDSIKTKYCLEKGIKLIRIPYTEFDRIEEVLTAQIPTLPPSPFARCSLPPT